MAEQHDFGLSNANPLAGHLQRPLYNAELAPPEIRGMIVSMQQLATTIGIMSAYWVGYGTNYIGGTGDSQHELAWRLPLIIQGIPAIILAIGVWFLPFSPRLLVNHDRDEEALQTLSHLRRLPIDHQLIQVEYLEIKAESEFEKRVFDKRFPHLANRARGNRLLRELAQYSNIFRTKDSFKRVAIGGTIMFFQQWSGNSCPSLHLRLQGYQRQLCSSQAGTKQQLCLAHATTAT